MEPLKNKNIKMKNINKYEIPTYFDLKYGSTSKIFEAEEIQGLSPDQIQEGERIYHVLVEKLQKGEEIDEGLLSGLAIGAASALFGSSIMRAICKALSIDENGVLGRLLTSKLILGSIGYTLGK